MKKIFFSSILFVSLGAHAQIDTTEVDTSQIKTFELPDSTGPGTPDGHLISKEIGPGGGTIASEDRRIELIFPEGALTDKAHISIQPVTNMLNGSGKAYQFEPSGIQFKKPVKIIFHYTDEEAETCPPDLKSFALQDHSGKWTFFEYNNWDSTEKSLTGFIHHFSALVADQNDVLLQPNDENVHVSKKTPIWILHRTRFTYTNGRATGNQDAEFIDEGEKGMGVFVNGKPGGNSSVGTAKIIKIHPGWTWLRYYAPEYLSAIRKGPIEIKLAFKYYSRMKKKVAWGRSKCYINIYDEYKISIVKIGKSILDCDATLEDASDFTVKFYSNKKPEINDVINSEPSIRDQADCKKESRGGRSVHFTLTYDPAGCQGPVHIFKERLMGYGLSGSEPEPPDVTIEFVPTMVKIMNGTIHYDIVAGVSTNKHYFNRQMKIPAQQPPDENADANDLNVGNTIKFTANRKHQAYDRPGEDVEHSFRLIVHPM